MKQFYLVAKAVSLGLLTTSSFAAVADEKKTDIEKIEVVSKFHRDIGATGLALAIGDTPQSISIVDSDFMEFFDTNSVGEALQHSTGTYSENSLSNRSHFVYSRGFSMNRYLVDGMGAAGRPFNTSMLDSSMFERIEVIRGSTGMLQEVGQPSGTINLIQKRATTQTEGSVSVGLGSWDKRRVDADVNVALTDDGSVRARAVGVYESSDYFQDYVNNDRKVIYTTLSADVTQKLTVSAFASYQSDEQNSIDEGIPYTFSNGKRVKADIALNIFPEWSKQDTEQANFMLEGRYQVNDDWDVQARLHHAKMDDFQTFVGLASLFDQDSGDFNYFVTRSDREYTSNRAEINVNGQFLLLNREHNINVGFANTEYEEAQLTVRPSSAVPANFYDSSTRNQPVPEFDYENGRNRLSEHESQSARVALNLNLVDNFSLLIGANHKNLDSSSARGTSTASEIDLSDTSIYVGGVLSLGERTQVYASHTDIFDLPQAYDLNGKLLEPLIGENLEVGVRFSTENDNISIDLAWFEISQENYPSYKGRSEAGLAYYESVDGVESQGYEVEINAYLTDQWSTIFSYTNISITDPHNGRITQIVPDEMAKFSTNYDFSDTLQGLRLGGYITYTGDRNGFLGFRRNVVYEPMSSFTLVGIAASYEINEQLSVKANINNLLDKEYDSKVAFLTVRPGEPRSYSVQMTYNF